MLPSPRAGGRVRGRRAAGTPSGAARRLGGRARAAAVGEGCGGRSAEGGGLARCPPASRASGSRAGAALFAVSGGSPPPLLAPRDQMNPKTSRRGAAVASEAALPRVWARALGGRAGGWRGEPSRGGRRGLGGSRGWRSAARDGLPSPGSPRPRTGRPRGARPQVGPPCRAGTALTFLDLTVEAGDSKIVRQTHSSHGKMQVMSEKAGVDPQKVVC